MASRLPRAPSSKPRGARSARAQDSQVSAHHALLPDVVPKAKLKTKAKTSVARDWTPGARSILDAAVTLFATDGFDSVSIAQIAEKAGVSKANVFHHFASKDDLYHAVMKHACTAHANFAEELHTLPISSVAKLKQLITFELNFGRDNRQLIKMTTREMIDGHARVKKLARDTMKRNFLAVSALMQQGIGAGEFAADLDPTIGAILVHSVTTYFFLTQHVMQAIPETMQLARAETYSEAISTMVLKSILS